MPGFTFAEPEALARCFFAAASNASVVLEPDAAAD
jgi:hypothetical protein